MAKLDDVLRTFREEVADFVSTSVVGMDGIPIGGTSMDPRFDTSMVGAQFATVQKTTLKAIAAVEAGKLEDILYTTDKVYILSRTIGDGSYFHSLTVAKKGNLGMARLIMKNYESKILEAIPK